VWFGGLAALAVGLFLAPCRAWAAEVPTEYQVKAAYLFNFVKYVEWPSNAFPGPTAPFVIGVLGQDPFGADLDKTVAGRSINNRPIMVKRVAGNPEAKSCHILFIGASDKARFEPVLEALKRLPILTVGDSESFPGPGGVISFVRKENKVRFQVNLSAAQARQLTISSKLLSVAESITGKTEGAGK
jgi:hypothetical protein